MTIGKLGSPHDCGLPGFPMRSARAQLMNTSEQSAKSSAKHTTTLNERVMNYWDKMGRLNLLSGVMGAENLKREADSHHRNREAEDAHVRRNVWGSEGSANETNENNDAMRDTVLGDINHPTPIIMPTQSSAWPIVAGLAMASLLPTAAIAGLAGYFLSRPAEQIEAPEFDDESVSVGLGRIVDTLQLTPVDQ